MSTNPMDSAEGREAFMYDLYPSYIATTAWGPLEEEAARRLADEVSRLPSAEVRLEAVAAMREQFCLTCGLDQPLHGTCQCWNDE